MGADRHDDFFSQHNEALKAEINKLSQENSRLKQELEAIKKSLASLHSQIARDRLVDEVANHIRQSLRLDNILQTAVTEVRQFLNVDRTIIYRFKPNWDGVVTVESAAPGIPAILYSNIMDPCFREGYVQKYQAGRIRALSDIYGVDLPACYRELLEEHHVRANLVVPILQGDNTLWGLLITHHCRDVRTWTREDIRLLQRLTTQLSQLHPGPDCPNLPNHGL